MSNSQRFTLAFALFLFCGSIACGNVAVARVPALNVRNLFPIVPGQTITMVNQSTAALTSFTTGDPVDFGCQGLAYPFTIHKTDLDTYIQPGVPMDATLYLRWTQQDSLVVTAVLASPWAGGHHTAQPAGRPQTYVAITPDLSDYQAPNLWNNVAGTAPQCLAPPVDATQQPPGYSAHYRGQLPVVTDVYTGPAYAFQYCEGDLTPQPWDAAGHNNCETWYFAPRIGLVQLVNNHYHYAGWDWDTGCHIFAGRNPDGSFIPPDPRQLAGVNWQTCTVPNRSLVTEPTPHQRLTALSIALTRTTE